MTDGKGPDCCIDCVGAEAHGADGFDPDIKEAQPDALAQIFKSCKKRASFPFQGSMSGRLMDFPWAWP